MMMSQAIKIQQMDQGVVAAQIQTESEAEFWGSWESKAKSAAKKAESAVKDVFTPDNAKSAGKAAADFAHETYTDNKDVIDSTAKQLAMDNKDAAIEFAKENKDVVIDLAKQNQDLLIE